MPVVMGRTEKIVMGENMVQGGDGRVTDKY